MLLAVKCLLLLLGFSEQVHLVAFVPQVDVRAGILVEWVLPFADENERSSIKWSWNTLIRSDPSLLLESDFKFIIEDFWINFVVKFG